MKSFLAGLCIACTFPLLLWAQEDTSSPVAKRRWSINAWANMNIPVSASMRGSIADFRADISRDYNNKSYPFRLDDMQYAAGWGVRTFYGLTENTNLYLGFSGNFFNTLSTASRDEAFLAIWSFQIGAEYSLFPRTSVFNVFGRADVAANWLGGFTDYDFFFGVFRTKVPRTGRIGIDAETGVRFLIPGTAVALEASTCYTNANLLGKSYTKPSVSPPTALHERELNDAKNPDDPNDAPRTIDFLQLKLGARIWF